MDVYNHWTSRDITKVYGAVRFKYSIDKWLQYVDHFLRNSRDGVPDPNMDVDEYADHQILVMFFEGLGILVKRRLVDS